MYMYIYIYTHMYIHGYICIPKLTGSGEPHILTVTKPSFPVSAFSSTKMRCGLQHGREASGRVNWASPGWISWRFFAGFDADMVNISG